MAKKDKLQDFGWPLINDGAYGIQAANTLKRFKDRGKNDGKTNNRPKKSSS
jgi:hypothetical protein